MTGNPRRRGRPPNWADVSSRILLDAAPDAMLVVSRAGEIVVTNLRAEKLFRYGRQELIGRSIESLIPTRLRTEHPQHRETFFGDPQVRPMGTGLKLFALRGDGAEVPVEISLSPLTTESGTFIVAAIRDVTERRRSEELKASEERSRRLVQSSSVAMIVSRGLEQKVELMNDKFTALFGYTVDDVPDVAHWWPLAYPDEGYREAVRAEWQARVEKAIRDVTGIEPMEATVRCKDGSTRHIEAHLSCMGDTNLVTLIDLTERKCQEAMLRDREERLRVATEVGRMYAWEWDPATDSVLRSAECADILGSGAAGEKGNAKDYFRSIHPDDRAELWSLVNALTPENPVYRTQYRMFRLDGALLWLEESGRATFGRDRKMVRLVGMTADITERRRAESALKDSEDRYRDLVEHSQDLMCTHDLQGRLLSVNPAVARVLGYEIGELLQMSIPDLLSPRARPLFHEFVAQIRRDGVSSGSMRVITRAGEERIWEYHNTLRTDDVPEPIVRGMARDVTDRKRAEKALQQKDMELLEAQRNVSRRLIEAQEKERTRIARDLHDDFGQRLALLTIELELLQQTSPDLPGEVRSRIGELGKQTSKIATDIQSLSHELHSSKLEYVGIAAAMRGFCQEFGEKQNVEVVFKTRDLPSPLSPNVSLGLFRVLQEAIRNGAKHSGVRHFEVRLWGTSGEIHLSVTDSGAGFDTEVAKRSRGLGLISMEERLKLLNGTISIESQPQRGTRVHACVPLAKESKAIPAFGAEARPSARIACVPSKKDHN
jgi:PAS domain S-box-containing protein